MKKNNKYVLVFAIMLLSFFINNVGVKAISTSQAQAIVDYEGANGMENSTSLTSGCPQPFFTIGGEIFYDTVSASSIAVAVCGENGSVACLNANESAATNKLSNIKNDAVRKGFIRQSDGSYMKNEYPQGCYRSSYAGVRVSIVNEDGTKKANTKIIDYWSETGTIYGTLKKANQIRTIIVNGSPVSFTSEASIVFKKDSKMGDYEKARITMKNEVIASSKSKKIKSNGYLIKHGIKKWTDFDEDDHILFEPLFVVTIDTTSYVGTGTEIFSLLMDHTEATWLRASFIKEIVSKMVLTEMKSEPKDDTDQTYTLNSNGKKYDVYQNLTSDPNELKNNPSLVLNQANGYAMELIWLKTYLEPKECTYEPGADFLVECCDDGTYLDDYFDANGPGDFIAACCEIDTYLIMYSTLIGTPAEELYEEYCEEPEEEENECTYDLDDPKFILQVCNDGDTDNTSVFMDPLFASGYLDSIGNGIARKISGVDNTVFQGSTTFRTVDGFLALAYSGDDYYIDSSSTYCTTYCQEKLEVTLPDNYPYVQAGRYFYWDINHTEHHVIEVKGERVCAHDIKLDEWYKAYDAKAKTCEDAGNVLGSCGDEIVGGDNDCVKIAQQELYTCEGNKSVKDTDEYIQEQKNNQAIEDELNSGNYDYELARARDEAYAKLTGNNANATYDTLKSIGYMDTGKFTGTPEELDARVNEMANETVKGKISSNLGGSGGVEDPCATEKAELSRIERAKSNYMSCTGIDKKGVQNKENAALVQHIKSLKSCFSDVDPEGEDTKANYVVDLDVDYGYETLVNGQTFFHTPNDILKFSNLLDEQSDENDNNEQTNASLVTEIDNGCFYSGIVDSGYGNVWLPDPCNSDKYFVSEYDICNGGDKAVIKYFPSSMKYHLKNNYNGWGNSDAEQLIGSPSYIGYYGGKVYTVPTYNISSDFSTDFKNNYDPRYNGGGIENTYETGWSVETEDLSKYWKTIYVTREIIDDYYVLNKAINACVCKDGEILDLTDGECECKTVTDYNIITDESTEYTCSFEWESSSYTVIEQEGGNFTVEFMNPSGLYPLYLNYGNIGFNGHFSELLQSRFQPKCPDGVCEYSTEENRCEFVINNKIINDGGKIEDAICPTDDCDNVCKDGDCSDFCEDGDCPRPIEEDIAIGGPELIYRVIDLDNPFPGSDAEDSDDSRSPGTNWNSSDSSVDLVEDYITNNRGVKGNALYSSRLEPFYSFTLTPASIKEIRKFNAANPDYASPGTMVYDDGTITGGVSYILRGTLRDKIVSPTGNEGYFVINLDDPRFDDINNNSNIGSDGMLTTCRDTFSGVSE